MPRLMIKIVLGFLALFPVITNGMSITYFGLTTLKPIHPTKQVKVCLLDQGRQLQHEMNQYLQHSVQPQSLASKQGLSSYQAQFQLIAQDVCCRFLAAKIGIKALPAMVINQKYVIYGQRDMAIALQEYKERVHD